MSSSRTLSRKFRTFFTCIKPRFDPSIILLYIAASVEQYCDITQVNALPENEGILERDKKFINLALQGGGSHGSFTWGVLDRLLEDGRLGIDGIVGTSAGAMNCAVAAYGLTIGGNPAARQASGILE